MHLNIFKPNGGLVTILKNRIRWFHSLQWKLILSYSLISLCPLFIFSWLMLNTMENYFKNDRGKSLLTDANIISVNISKGNFMNSNRLQFDNELESKSNDGGYRIIVLDNMGTVVNDSNKTDIGKTYIIPEVIDTFNKKDHTSLRKKERRLYTSASILNAQSEKIGVVLIVSSAEEIFLAIEQIEQKLFFLMLFTCLIILGFVLFISNLIMDPLKKTLLVIKKMTAGQLDQRIIIKNHDEFAHLAFSFNKLTDKLEQIENAREEFVSNVSHELKTPLSAIKVLSESMLTDRNTPIEIYREFLGDINSEIDRMTNIVNDLLTLVKLDKKRFPLNIRETNLNNMLENIIKRLMPLADKKNIEIEFTHKKNIILQADEMKLSLAISNLIDNGIKYTQSGGKIKINTDSDENFAFITIQDNGVGISRDEQNKIFERFYRIDKTRDRETGGTGLGLSITHSAITMHNGKIELTSEEGLGTTFYITLPIDPTKNTESL